MRGWTCVVAVMALSGCNGGGSSTTTKDDGAADQDQDGQAAPDDCDDADADIHSGATEVPYDDVDQDCDGQDLVDVDGDGSDAEIADGADCDDASAAIHPGADEVYYDDVDNDCDPATVDDDQDGDGETVGTDCDDVEPAVSSTAPEVYYDGLDNDCDAETVDDDQDHDRDPVDTDCDDLDPLRSHERNEVYYDGIDNDCRPNTDDADQDGDGDPIPSDCDDRNATIFSGGVEVAHDNIDNDCDPSTPDEPLLDPVAVGFGITGGLLPDGAISDYELPGYGLVEPSITLTFATLTFFDGGLADPADETCTAIGLFDPPPLVQPDQIPTWDGAVLYTSFDTSFSIAFTDCEAELDPAIWGPNGRDLLDAFEGAHIGIGFGPMTPYLEGAWLPQDLVDYGDSMVASYIAINDASGAWVATDWTTSLLWAWDPVTHLVTLDAAGALQPLDVTGTAPGGLLPSAYIQSYPYWYQDFPLMDLTNLSDPPL